jgi:hypothetical protein
VDKDNGTGMGFPGFGMDNVPTLGQLEFKDFRYRVGKTFSQNLESGEMEFAGIIIEVWFVPIPWFRVRLPFERIEGQAFLKELREMLDVDETAETAS